jgi:predicted tellurium resistance membrane protein TerC
LEWRVFDWIFSTEIWMALVTLTTLEIVLGVDNLVFISIAVSKLPPERRPWARKFGLALACITRILLLISLAFLARMQTDLFSLFGNPISIRDLVLIGGGLFLLVKGTMEIHDAMEGRGEDESIDTKPSAVFGYVIAQIAIIDIVFSLDSVITAVGIAHHIPIMVAAILHRGGGDDAWPPIHSATSSTKHPTIKMLALAFLILVGMAVLIAGWPRHTMCRSAYIYFAMAFSGGVETLNLLARRRQTRRRG